MRTVIFALLMIIALADKSISQQDTTTQKHNLTFNQSTESYAKEPVYKIKAVTDVPITAIGTAWSLYAFTKIYSKDRSPEADILALDENDINGFDRWAANIYDERYSDASDFVFYGSMPYPIVLLFDKAIRKDAGKMTFLYLEAMSITGLLYTGSVYLTDRYRPYAYNDEVPMSKRTRGGAKNSFFAGHVALVATSTFFVAKVYSDYHPDSRLKWLLYGLAGTATAATAYMRHKGGQHFPSDILLGIAVGTASGILVPHVHKNKLLKEPKVSVSPLLGPAKGIALTYRL